MQDNSKGAIYRWAREAIAEAIEKGGVSEEKGALMLEAAKVIIACGGWRGNVSVVWKERFEVTTADVPDLYL